MPSPQRPLSPFMIGPYYRPQLTSVLSFLHRITGILLAVAAAAVVCGLLCLAAGPDTWATFTGYAGGWLGKLVALGFLYSLCFHFLNGIRHLGWDVGWGFELKKTYATGWLVFLLSVVLTALVAWLVYSRMGAV